MPSDPDPITEFERLFQAARKSEIDATQAALATADGSGRPAVRMVLLKSFDEHGFVFFTNYGSRKAEHLSSNPWAAMCFYWNSLGRQIRIEGPVARIAATASDEYFATRPRGSQVAAWASSQSRRLSSRFELLRRYVALRARFAGRPIPRPEFWGGFRLTPERIEFWDSRRHRLHDRRLFLRQRHGWKMERLFP